MAAALVDEQVRAAIQAIEREDVPVTDKVDMLVEIAMGLQTRPRAPHDLHQAVHLYEKALALCEGLGAHGNGRAHAGEEAQEQGQEGRNGAALAPEATPAPLLRVLRARVLARMGTALQAIPEEGSTQLERAERCYEEARPILEAEGSSEEVAELHMNRGLVLQTLAGMGKRSLRDAIAAYQEALRVFDRKRHPKEFAILQNNLATAYLSMPFADKKAKMREALAVQAFEEGLKVVNLIDHPNEYAMLQNNLGNALQYASTSHIVENNLRALEAYGEALKVRTREAAPIAWANTTANKANCLANLPDAALGHLAGSGRNRAEALRLYREALAVFEAHGEADKCQAVREAIAALECDESEAGGAGEPSGGAPSATNGAGLENGDGERAAATLPSDSVSAEGS